MPGFTICRGAVLSLLLTLAAPAWADEESERLLRDFVENIDSSAEWTASVASIVSDGDDTIGEGLVFSRDDGEASVSIEWLRLEQLEERDGGGFTASAIEVEGFGLTSPLVDYAVPSASVEDVSVPGAEGIGFDPQHLMRSVGELYSLLAEAEFSNFELPELRIDQADMNLGPDAPSNIEVVYRDLTIAEMADSVTSEVRAGPILFTGKAGNEEAFRFQIEEVTSGEMDVGALAHILDPAAYEGGRGDGIWRSIVSEIAYSGLSGTGTDGSAFRIDRFSLMDLEGRQPETPFTDEVDRLIDPSIPQHEKEQFALDAVVALYSPWRLGSFGMEGISIVVPRERANFQLGEFLLTGLSLEGLDSFSLSKLRAAGREGFASLESLEIEGIVFPDIRTITEIGESNSSPSAELTTSDIRSLSAAMPRLAHFGLHGLAGGPSPAEAFTLGSFTIDLDDWNDFFAGRSAVRLDQLYIPPSLLRRDPRTAEAFAALGYERLALGMSLDQSWSQADGTQQMSLGVTVEDGGELAFSYALDGLTEAWMLKAIEAGQSDDSDAAMMALLAELRLQGAKLTVTDDSLVDRAFAAAVAMQHLDMDAKAYKLQTAMALPFLLSTFAPPDFVQLVSKPVVAFLQGGQQLVATVVPPQPVPLPDIIAGAADPMGLVDRLQLLITSNPAPR